MSVAAGCWIIIGALLLCVLFLWRMIMATRRVRKSTHMLIEALRNGDTAFLPQTHDKIVAGNLDEIRHMLADMRAEGAARDSFINAVVERSATGIVVFRCRDKRAVIYNKAALRLLERPVVTSERQFAGTQLGDMLENSGNIGTKAVNVGGNVMIASVSQVISGEETYDVLTLDDATSVVADRDMDAWMRFSQVMAHEINNAIMPIRSLASNLLQHDDASVLTDGVRGQLEAIVSASGYLHGFVESYRHLSHLPDPVPHAFLLRDFLGRAVNLCCFMMPDSADGLDVTIDMNGREDIMVYCDEGMLTQAIINILKNAMENAGACGSAAKVIVSGRIQDDESVVIDIADNGPEIPENVVDRIFIPFFTTKQSGSGIGLALSRQLLRKNCGVRLELLHREPHPVFRITIP